jgi:hypothetical protein
VLSEHCFPPPHRMIEILPAVAESSTQNLSTFMKQRTYPLSPPSGVPYSPPAMSNIEQCPGQPEEDTTLAYPPVFYGALLLDQ